MLSATFTGMVTTHYEEAFVSLPLLVSFMPMLMDTAGNCGNQISTLMVRGLALGEVEPSDFLKVLGKESCGSPAIVGAVLGLVNGLRIYLMYTYLYAGQYQNVIGYAVVVSVSLFFSVILAKLVGGMLPLAAKKLGADRPSWRPLHHHHRGRLQLDPLLPDRTGCLPRHDVNTQKRPCSGSAERGRSVSQRQQGPRLAACGDARGVLLFGVLLWCEEESCARVRLRPRTLVSYSIPELPAEIMSFL
ncbi:MAG: magnesium transporter [Faecalibacterium sp.]